MPHPWSRLTILLILACGLAAAPPASAQPDAAAQTVADPGIDEEVLRLRLLPLTADEVQVEAEAWVRVLQAKVAELSAAMIASREAEGEERAGTLERVVALQSERTALLARVAVVLDDLAAKGGEREPLDAYVGAVSGIAVDVTDVRAVSTWLRTWLVSPDGGVRWARNIVLFLGTLLVFWIAGRVAGRIVRRTLGRVGRTSALLRDFLVNITRNAILLIGVIVAVSMLEVNVGPLVAAVGAAGFVVGFALKDTLSNFASGVMILLYQPFDVGDVVTVAGTTGKVEAMTLVSTTILTPDNQRIVVPNNSIWGGVITNVTGSTTRRVDMTFGIGYGDDVERTRSILEEIVTSHEKVLGEPAPVVRLSALADSSVDFIVRPWARTEDYWDVHFDVTRAVKERFDAAGISIPYPQQDVHLHTAPPTG